MRVKDCRDKDRLIYDLLEVLFQLAVGNNQGNIKTHPWKTSSKPKILTLCYNPQVIQ
jgi:hypothetical protein